MLQPLLKAYQRRRRPLSDHHFLVMAHVGLAYGRCPHTADDAIRAAILRLAGADLAALPAYATGTLRDWTDGLTLLLASQLARRHPGIRVFAALRNPATRLASCFLHHRTEGGEAGASLAPGDDVEAFRRFVAKVCATPDWRSPKAWRSQTEILSHRGRLVPAHLVRHESRDEDWETVRGALLADGGPDIGPLRSPDRTQDARIEELLESLSAPLRSSLRRRYRADYARFYPDDAGMRRLAGAAA